MALELRGDFDARRLWLAAKGSKNGPQARRLLALAGIYEGATRTRAAEIGGVPRRGKVFANSVGVRQPSWERWLGKTEQVG